MPSSCPRRTYEHASYRRVSNFHPRTDEGQHVAFAVMEQIREQDVEGVRGEGQAHERLGVSLQEVEEVVAEEGSSNVEAMEDWTLLASRLESVSGMLRSGRSSIRKRADVGKGAAYEGFFWNSPSPLLSVHVPPKRLFGKADETTFLEPSSHSNSDALQWLCLSLSLALLLANVKRQPY